MTKNLFYFSLISCISYLFSSAQCFAPIVSTEFDCSTAQPPAINCAVDPNCLYPNPRNCSQYYQCDDTLQAYTMECPLYQTPNLLLVFNNNTKRCDFPENYNCLATPTPSTPPENEQPVETTTTTANQNTSTEVPSETPNTVSSSPSNETPQSSTDLQSETTTTDDHTEAITTDAISTSLVTDQETTTKLTTTPPTENDPPVNDGVCYTPLAQQELSVNCDTARRCKFANPVTCHGYVQCVASIDTPPYNPIAYNMSCPLGNDGQLLYWNDNSYTCERREDSTCSLLISQYRL